MGMERGDVFGKYLEVLGMRVAMNCNRTIQLCVIFSLFV